MPFDCVEDTLSDPSKHTYTHAKQAPKRIIFGPLAKTSTGKVQKYQLRKQAKETHHHHKHGGKKPQL